MPSVYLMPDNNSTLYKYIAADGPPINRSQHNNIFLLALEGRNRGSGEYTDMDVQLRNCVLKEAGWSWWWYGGDVTGCSELGC